MQWLFVLQDSPYCIDLSHFVYRNTKLNYFPYTGNKNEMMGQQIGLFCDTFFIFCHNRNGLNSDSWAAERFGPEYVGWRDVPSEELRHKVTVCVFRERNPHPTRPRPRSGRGSRTAWGWWRSEVNTLLSDFSVCCLWYPPLVGLCVCSQTPRLNTQTPLYILRRRKQIGK